MVDSQGLTGPFLLGFLNLTLLCRIWFISSDHLDKPYIHSTLQHVELQVLAVPRSFLLLPWCGSVVPSPQPDLYFP